MFLKVMHFEPGSDNLNSTSYDLYEGKLVSVIWENKEEKMPLRFVINDDFVDVNSPHKKEIFIMNNEGKTIERITKRSELTEKQIKEQFKTAKSDLNKGSI